MGRFTAVATLLLALASCSDKKKSEGLPPAQEWSADPSGGMADLGAAAQSPHAAVTNNPHAGLDMSGDGNNPHAGLDMNGTGDNPHGGGGGVDVSKMGLPPPDPNRTIDPAHHVKGVIRVHPKARDRVKPGTAVFLIVKRSVDGAASGPPLAVDKLTWGTTAEIPFEMTEAQAMIAGTQLVGDVIVIAHYDQDGDAISKQPGDVLGEAHVKVPADNVVLTLDNVLP